LKRFPVKLTALWRQAFPGLVLGAMAGRLGLWLQGEDFSLPNTLPLMAAAALMVVLMHALQPTLAGAQGLRVMNVWGVRRPLAWSQIRSATLGRLYGVQPSVKLTDGQGKSYWIARDTQDLRGLYDIARQHGGAQHPLTRVLETPLFAL
jgi:hypothetical protein